MSRATPTASRHSWDSSTFGDTRLRQLATAQAVTAWGVVAWRSDWNTWGTSIDGSGVPKGSGSFMVPPCGGRMTTASTAVR